MLGSSRLSAECVVRALLALSGRPERPCEEAHALASSQLAAVEDKLRRLEALREELLERQKHAAAASRPSAASWKLWLITVIPTVSARLTARP